MCLEQGHSATPQMLEAREWEVGGIASSFNSYSKARSQQQSPTLL